MIYSEQFILKRLNQYFLSSPKYVMNNLHVFRWESDYLAITKSLYSYEIEVKISLSDFKADFKKKEKHLLLNIQNKNKSKSTPIDKDRPNYFWYCCPPDIIPVDMVPWYAGLCYITEKSYSAYKIIKPAPMLHKSKFDINYHNLTDKFYYNMNTWKERSGEKMNNIKDIKQKTAKDVACNIIDKAEMAFKNTCPYAVYDYGHEFPMCGQEPPDKNIRDCMLQCSRGREFKKKLLK